MSQCPSCGASNNAGATFCHACGATVAVAPAPAAAMGAPVAVPAAPGGPQARPIGVTLVGLAMVVLGAVMVLVGFVVMLFVGALGAFFGAFDPFDVDNGFGAFFGMLGFIAAMFLFGTAALMVVTGIGALRARGWAWVLVLVLMGLNAARGLLGLARRDYESVVTLLVSGLVIWYFLTPEVQRFFGRA